MGISGELVFNREDTPPLFHSPEHNNRLYPLDNRLGQTSDRLSAYDPEDVVAAVQADVASLTVQVSTLFDELDRLEQRISDVDMRLSALDSQTTPPAPYDDSPSAELSSPWASVHGLPPEDQERVNKAANLFLHTDDGDIASVTLTKLGGERTVTPEDLEVIEPLIWQYVALYYARKEEWQHKLSRRDYTIHASPKAATDQMLSLRNERGYKVGSTDFKRIADKQYAVIVLSESFRRSYLEYHAATHAAMRELKATDLGINLTERRE